MTLENMVLEKLSEWQPPVGRQDLHLAVEGWAATMTADRSDALGCLLWELNLRRDGSESVDLARWANAAAEHVTGLMEPLKIVEIDTIRKEAQLRSESPLQRKDKRFYYELVLRDIGHAAMRRFQTVDGKAGREQVAFAITHEALAKLAGDVAEAAR